MTTFSARHEVKHHRAERMTAARRLSAAIKLGQRAVSATADSIRNTFERPERLVLGGSVLAVGVGVAGILAQFTAKANYHLQALVAGAMEAQKPMTEAGSWTDFIYPAAIGLLGVAGVRASMRPIQQQQEQATGPNDTLFGPAPGTSSSTYYFSSTHRDEQYGTLLADKWIDARTYGSNPEGYRMALAYVDFAQQPETAATMPAAVEPVLATAA